jgi:hypothetical protein
MSNNKYLEEYKKMYSDYVEARVNLHNYHTVFVNKVGLESCQGVRKNISEMAKLERELRLLAWKAHKEQLEIDREWRKTHRKQKVRNTSGLKQKKQPNDVDISE